MTDVLTKLSVALVDRYTIERELGAGGMATVYLAHDVRHDRKVALKVLRPELSAILGGERFLAEIKTTANLQHPHILSLFDSGEADGTVFYVMPYVEGESLRDRLNREKQLPVDDAIRIATEVASALDYAHRHAVVHRDIKPENVLLQEGRALVADFGIALAASRSDGGTRMTETGMSLGTPHYMAPEQAMGEREITAKADIYALGCVLYEMLTGEPPFTGPTAQAIIARVMTEEPRSLTLQRRTVPPHVEAVVRKALEKLPADRFGSAAQFAEALDRADLVGVSTTRAAAAAAPTPRRKFVALVRTGVLLLAGGAAGALAVWRLRPHPSPAPVARLAVPLAGVTSSAAFSPIFSPDGSRITFIGVDSSRTQRVYLRAMDREAPTPVPGTEGTANSSYFSPDGQWIVFRQGTKLRKVSVAGGAALALGDFPVAISGITWGSRDVIVVSNADTLVRLPAAGGAAVKIIGPDSASGVLRYTNPHFLPDGRTLLVSRTAAQQSELVAVDIDTRRVTPLGIAGISPWYVNGGHLVFADPSGTILTVGFDPRTLKVRGTPAPVAENVNVDQGVFARFSVSRNGTMVYFSGASTERRELVMVNRAGRVDTLGVAPAAYRFPRFSPDGRHIAVGIESSTQALFGNIWEYNLSSRRLTRLTFDDQAASPEWTPDGRAITFIARTPSMTEVRRVAADGSTDPALLFRRPATRVYEARLLPDGHSIVFREDANVRDLMIAPVDSPQAARPLAATSFNERAFALSPDGRWLAFVSNQSGASEIYVRRIEEGSPRWKVSTTGGVEPRWGPGGRELLYRDGDSVFVVSAQLGTDARFGEPRALFGGPFQRSGNDVVWDVAPDGRTFAMVRPLGATSSISLHLIMNLFDQPARPAGAGTQP